MKNIFQGILITAPLAALVLWFAFTGKEEVKAEQHLKDADFAIQSQQFDDDFRDAFNGMTNDPEDRAKIIAHRNERMADLKAQAVKAKEKRDHLDQLFSEAEKDMTDAIKEEGGKIGNDDLNRKRSATLH